MRNWYKLADGLRDYGRVCIAFSGGVDSTFLAFAAADALGAENVLCVTVSAPAFPEREREVAAAICKEYGIRHIILDFDQLGVEGFVSNNPDRCYFCKYELLSRVRETANVAGFYTLADGTNTDDMKDFRPGMKAVRELGVVSPLLDAGYSKEKIRGDSKFFGLKGWDRQSFACLASRFVYGEKITAAKLEMAGKAEQFLLDKGFDFVRVRINESGGLAARIETAPAGIARFADAALREEIAERFREIGFVYVSLDLEGYRTGSMNAGVGQA